MIGRKRFFHQLQHGQSRCFRCGRKFRRNEAKFYMYPPLVGGERVCAECKAKEARNGRTPRLLEIIRERLEKMPKKGQNNEH